MTANVKNLTPRVVGSNYTVFSWMGSPIAYCTAVQDTGQVPLGAQQGQSYQIIQPLGNEYPTDIVTTRILQAGTLTLTVTELWNAPAWTQLGESAGLSGISTAQDLIQIFEAQDALTTPITAQMLIKPPNSTSWRGWNYTGIKITGIDVSESIALGAITVSRNITCQYLRRTELAMSATGPLTS